MKEKKIYISGKMGEKVLSKATASKFAEAGRKLTAEGWLVFNPACKGFQEELHEHVKFEEEKWKDFSDTRFDWYAWSLLYDMHYLALCDAIYLLKDWKDSPGATAEYYFAKASNKVIIFED